METESSDQRAEWRQKKQELAQLREQLSLRQEEKEKAFHEFKLLHDKIKAHTARLTQLKQERDNLTQHVKAVKGERDQFNLAAREKSEQRKSVEEKQEQVYSHLKVRENPRALKAEIRRLETKIETEALPFTKEQQITKQIKVLKVRAKALEQVEQVQKEMTLAAADFSQARRVAQESHHQVQKLAEQSQQKHEEMNQLYDEIRTWREQEKPLAGKHRQLREQYQQVRKALELVSARVQKLNKSFWEEEEKSFNEKVREKTAAVQEKLKAKKKLSMDDILAFQASKE